MPAVARKQTPESHQNYRTVGDERVPTRTRAPRGHRWHEAPPVKSGAQKAGVRSTPARRQADDSADLSDLLEHFTGENAARTAQQQKEVEAHRVARKRARLRHRPFRMTVLASAMVGAPLGLLACLLWMNSNSLALTREDNNLRDQIIRAQFESENAQKEITSLNASPQVEQWAKGRGWSRASQNDFDDVSKGRPSATIQPEGESSDAP